MQINLGQYTSLATLLLNPSKLYINNEMANNLHMKTLLLCLVTLSCTSMLFYFGSLPHIENTAGVKSEYLHYISKPGSVDDLYLERKHHLERNCPAQQAKLQKDQLDHILVDKIHKLLYCYVPKVACTNWKRIFMVLSGKSNTTNILSIPADAAHDKNLLLRLNSFSDSEVEHMLKTFTKFIFVRHPFERLLSAYRNKLEQHYLSSRYFQARFGRYIIKRYRKQPSEYALLHGDDVTFEEFVAYVTDPENKAFNEHWKPIYSLCHPCSIHYDIIGKYETLYQDSDYILTKIGMKNLEFPYTSKPSKTTVNMRKYYKNLTSESIWKLYDIYQLDFRLFGYTFHDLTES